MTGSLDVSVEHPAVLITRPEPGASALAEELSRKGWRGVLCPMLRIVRTGRVMAADLEGVKGAVLTSPAGARAFADDVSERKLTPPARCYCVGEATAEFAAAVGFRDIASAQGGLEDLARRLARVPPTEGPLLWLRGRDVAGDLPRAAAQLGARAWIREKQLYAANAVETLSADGAEALDDDDVEAVLIFSARTAEAFARIISETGRGDRLKNAAVVAISARALAPLEALPARERRVAAEPTSEAVVNELLALAPPLARLY